MTQTSTQTLNEFVKSVVSGEIKFAAGGRSSGKIIEYTANPDTKDIEAIAAEAVNREIVDSDTSWDQLVKQIKDIIAELNA